ncbi:unnamed protein product [Tuber aestivum]|uniref:Uncharacterized protein n=1 Tax=Tuber aestivum TaxID=59557 RepID=A0A292PU29_9PEZI|nr:unnamed protein product [Tuber aestivum]
MRALVEETQCMHGSSFLARSRLVQLVYRLTHIRGSRAWYLKGLSDGGRRGRPRCGSAAERAIDRRNYGLRGGTGRRARRFWYLNMPLPVQKVIFVSVYKGCFTTRSKPAQDN